uniref:Uncharacterized protein LOC104227649 n=1 Tax=Nicotiana sylvestris TaxID=4096 RepID=A0A1U7WU55_NICSY|nr:PREDICTED: uncharacterized protein LOC104227649 [Nicotiana sylvestris]
MGLPHEDPQQHILNFLKISDTYITNGVTPDYVRLTLFPFSLLGEAKRWLKAKPANSITSRNDLARKFLASFFPSGKTAKIRSEIVAFKQKVGESLYLAWERLKGLLRDCPHHNQTNEVLSHTFIEGLHPQTKIIVDAAAGGQQSGLARRAGSEHGTKIPGVLELDVISALLAHVSTLTNQVNQMTMIINKQQAKPVQQVQIFCEVCGEGQMSNLCPANPESVYFVCNANRGQTNQYGDNYNPNRRNHPNFSCGGNQGNQNQYRPQALQQKSRPPQAEQQASLEGMMKKLMADQAQNSRPIEALPSDTKPNPKAQVNAVTLRNGRALEKAPKKKKNTAYHEGELVPKPVEGNEKDDKAPKPVIETSPPPPFPQRLQKQKDDAKYKKFLDILSQVSVNLPLVKILQEVPKYARYLRDIVANKRRHAEFETVSLTEECRKLKMRVDDEKVTFNVYKARKLPKHYEDLCMITMVELKGIEQSQHVNYSDPDGTTELEEVVFPAERVKMIEKRTIDERGDLPRACKKARLHGRKKKRKHPT